MVDIQWPISEMQCSSQLMVGVISSRRQRKIQLYVVCESMQCHILLFGNLSVKSTVHKINSRRPSIEPWGTEHVIWTVDHIRPSCTMYNAKCYVTQVWPQPWQDYETATWCRLVFAISGRLTFNLAQKLRVFRFSWQLGGLLYTATACTSIFSASRCASASTAVVTTRRIDRSVAGPREIAYPSSILWCIEPRH